MEHQKCRICGDRHPLGPCPSLAGKSKAEKISDLKKQLPETVTIAFDIIEETTDPKPIRKLTIEERCRMNGLTVEVAAEKYLDGLEKTRLRLAKHRSKT